MTPAQRNDFTKNILYLCLHKFCRSLENQLESTFQTYVHDGTQHLSSEITRKIMYFINTTMLPVIPRLLPLDLNYLEYRQRILNHLSDGLKEAVVKLREGLDGHPPLLNMAHALEHRRDMIVYILACY